MLDERKQASVQVVDVDDQIVSIGGDLVGFQVCTEGKYACVPAGEQAQSDIGYVDRIHRKSLVGHKQGVATVAGSDVQGSAGPRQVDIVRDRGTGPVARSGEAMFAVPFQPIRMHRVLCPQLPCCRSNQGFGSTLRTKKVGR
ncbi:MAG: hypothetical protein AMJ54_06925 [Deltaproteobacteria bacterium SG8_13]|nr:MAG: hypothetical protein AMJ54_06925 [Deltaproteobacteria bacterium SG8_13]